jgi:hexosaminidase
MEINLKNFKRDSIYKLELIPMIWGYMENVPSYFQPSLYEKYGRIFQNVWIASAYKGASGELSAITSIQHHYLNHISWIDVLLEKHRNKIVNFTG